MHPKFALIAAIAALSVTACSGGGGGGSTALPVTNPTAANATPAPTSPPSTPPTSNPNPTPTPAATTAPAASGNAPAFETVTTHAGAQSVLVDPSSHHTLYYVDGDTPPGTGCNTSGSCTTIWPPMTTAQGSQGAGNLTIVTRTDNTQQWSYKGHALYHFSGDSGADQDNGEYGPWHPAAQ